MEDYPGDHAVLGSADAVVRPTGGSIFQVGCEEHKCNSSISCAWVSVAMVRSSGTRVPKPCPQILVSQLVSAHVETNVVCRATSATSHVILGQFKTCVILLGGYLFFASDPGLVSIIGAVLALSGMSVYTSLNHNFSSKTVEDKPPIV